LGPGRGFEWFVSFGGDGAEDGGAALHFGMGHGDGFANFGGDFLGELGGVVYEEIG
jgi:hypothetical protein